MEKEDMAIQFMEFCKLTIDSPNYDEKFWLFTEMDDIVCNHPTRALDIIERICDLMLLEMDLDNIKKSPVHMKVVGSVSAGSLEDLFKEHGKKIIDDLERRALKNPLLRYMLGGVWTSSIDPEVTRRIEAIRTETW
jgi:hypothetical protein